MLIYVGPCPYTTDEKTMIVPANLTSYTINGVYEFSLYNITVAGLKNGVWYQSSQQTRTQSAGNDFLQ